MWSLGFLDLPLHVFFVFIDLVADLLVESAPFAFVKCVMVAVTELPVGADLFEFIDAPLSDELSVIDSRRLVSVHRNDFLDDFEHLIALFLVGRRNHEFVELCFSNHEGLERKREC